MSFRLLNVHTGQLSEYPLINSPPYLAASHAWSEQLFPIQKSFFDSPGRRAVLAVIEQRYPGIDCCWVDTICIDQNDDSDKHRQIPLMGQIFGGADAVVIILNQHLGMKQEEIDRLTQQLGGAITMHQDETWGEDGAYWQHGEGRNLIAHAMRGLSQLTTTSWSTRIWTLQEYILARNVIWIGTDLVSLSIQDILLAALPDVCDTLLIDECIGGIFEKLYGYFGGMANMRLRRGDRTRVMELLGNRQATLECDEVYGVMAAAGVEISTTAGEKKEIAWRRWVEEAVRRGHIRWLLMPNATKKAQSLEKAGSALDTVDPLGPIEVVDGTATVSGRWIGSCSITTRLGTVHEPTTNRIHRDITLILFTQGRWDRAVKIASVFGAGRYNRRQTLLIVRALIDNFPRAVQAVRRGREDVFMIRTQGGRQAAVWQDFMAFQMGQMPGMNEGIAYLARIQRHSLALEAVVVLANDPTHVSGQLEVIDLGARTIDKRCVFMIISGNHSDKTSTPLYHKVAVTLPVTGDYEQFVTGFPLEKFSIGGARCEVCNNLPASEYGNTNQNSQNTLSMFNYLDAAPPTLQLLIRRKRTGDWFRKGLAAQNARSARDRPRLLRVIQKTRRSRGMDGTHF